MGFPVVHSKKKSKIWRRGYMTASTGGRSLSTAHTNHPPLVCVSIVVNVELCHLKAAFSASYAAPDPLWVRTRMVLVYKYSAFIVFFSFFTLVHIYPTSWSNRTCFFSWRGSGQLSVPQNPRPALASALNLRENFNLGHRYCFFLNKMTHKHSPSDHTDSYSVCQKHWFSVVCSGFVARCAEGILALFLYLL